MTGKNAKKWDSVYEGFKENGLSIWKECATPFFAEKIDFLKEHNVKKILDAGCGDARNTVAFAEAGFEIIGIDSSEEACKKARKQIEKYKTAQINQKDIRELNYCKEFDTIICDYVLVHIEEIERVLENFYNALKEGGFLIAEFMSTDDPHSGNEKNIGRNAFIDDGIFCKYYSLEEVKKLLSKFEILEVEKIVHSDPGHGSKFPRDKPHKHDSIYVLAKKINN